MYQVRQTESFVKWLRNLRDVRARSRIVSRLEQLEDGHFGDHEFFGEVGELRFHFGPGYRVYYSRCGSAVIILLHGGDKSTQQDDIKKAKAMAKGDQNVR